MGSREDIRNLEWADMRNREATICYLKMTRAQEEIQRLNVEIKRLSTWIYDEAAHLDHAVSSCAPHNSHLSQALYVFAEHRKRINNNLLRILKAIYVLPGYSGETSVGQREQGSEKRSTVDPHVSDEDEVSDDADYELIDEIFEGVSRITLHE
jgi:hypothetical protein